jgi:hypothetical protein
MKYLRNNRTPAAWSRCALVTLLMMVSGCAQENSNVELSRRSLSSMELAKKIDFWEPHLLYLTSKPYSSLYVEIDAVEGAEPTDSELEELQSWISQYCAKPDGVVISLDTIIPRNEIQGELAASIALRHLDGPPESMGNSAAYMYILFYNSGVSESAARHRISNPYMTYLPYPCAIFIDRNYFKVGNVGIASIALRHESGHLLGLTRNQEHGDGIHCNNDICLMSEALELSWWKHLLRQPQSEKLSALCSLCQEDLRRDGDRSADPKLRFLGPLLIRSEQDYHVISLPSFVKLYVGSIDALDWREVVNEARSTAGQIQEKGGGVALRYYVEADEGDGLASALPAIQEAKKNDPYHVVRGLAEEVEHQLERKLK